MAQDYYSILGVTPASEDVVIRAAYRALIRRYHPDADPSSDASQRAQAINAAYAVLSDPEKRARYDGSLAAAGLIKPHPEPRRTIQMPAIPAIPRPRGSVLIFVGVLAFLAAAIAMSPPLGQFPGAPAILDETPPAKAPSEPIRRAAATAQAAIGATELCNRDAAHGLVKNELFRRAAELNGGGAAALGTVAKRSLVRIQSETTRDARNVRTVACNGWLALDLPPGIVVDGGRSNLNSEIAYSLAEAGRSGLRLTELRGVEALIGSLATLSSAPREQDFPAPAVPEVPGPEVGTRRVAAAPAARITAAKSAANGARITQPTYQASFSCSLARSPAERTICRSSNLAALDRHLALFYSQSLGRAQGETRDSLIGSGERFRERRDACRSESCLTNAYVARMREVSEIMARRSL